MLGLVRARDARIEAMIEIVDRTFWIFVILGAIASFIGGAFVLTTRLRERQQYGSYVREREFYEQRAWRHEERQNAIHEIEIETGKINLEKAKKEIYLLDRVEERYSSLMQQQNEFIEEQKGLILKQEQAEKKQREFQREWFEYGMTYSLGIDPSLINLYRYLPIRIYLDESRSEQIENIEKSIIDFINLFDFAIADEFLPEKGSWFKKFFAKSKEVLSQPEVIEKLKKVERAIELQTLQQSQANVDKTQAEGVSILLNSLDNCPTAVLQIGSLLIVKTNEIDGKGIIIARTLTQNELIYLEKHPYLLRNPSSILKSLSEHSKSPTNLPEA